MTDDLTAELDRIASETRTFGASGEDTARLLAAVETVLRLADTWDAQARQASDRSDAANESGETGTFYLAIGKALTLDECTDALREAITREITGKGESDGPH